jgi:hypothetical protein
VVRVALSLYSVMFCRSLLGHRIVCPSMCASHYLSGIFTHHMICPWSFLVTRVIARNIKRYNNTESHILFLWPITNKPRSRNTKFKLSNQKCFSGVRVARSLVFCVMFCRSLFVLLSFFFLVIVLCVLIRFTASDYPFSIYKLFLQSPRSIDWSTRSHERIHWSIRHFHVLINCTQFMQVVINCISPLCLCEWYSLIITTNFRMGSSNGTGDLKVNSHFCNL